MNDYELTVITREESITDLESLIENAGGQIQSRQPMGRKNLAYPIKKETAAYYTALGLNLDPSKIENLNNKLLLEPNLLRHLLVVMPTHKLTSNLDVEEIKEAKEVKEEAEPTSKSESQDDQKRSEVLDKELNKIIGGEDAPQDQKEI